MLGGNDGSHLMHRGNAHHLMAGGVQQMHDVHPRDKVAVGEARRLEPLKHHIGVFHQPISRGTDDTAFRASSMASWMAANWASPAGIVISSTPSTAGGSAPGFTPLEVGTMR